MKKRHQRIPMLTAYDYPTARLIDAAGIPIVLVGDSVGTTVLGYENTIPVTLDDIIHHARAVVRGTRQALVVADLPFMTYHVSPEQALQSAARLIQDGGAQAVKLEGGDAAVVETVRRLVAAGIPVQGHLGLTPQSLLRIGGYRVQGRGAAAARRLQDEAKQLQDAGAFSLVLELVPAHLAETTTQALSIPTIGIGAGPYCDGQVQVIHDLLGLDPDFHPRHARRYANLAETIREAVAHYADDVRAGSFPSPAESFDLAADEMPTSARAAGPESAE
jgi:3-methyl-2-oxobutanoate hydroxymethyltransferase